MGLILIDLFVGSWSLHTTGGIWKMEELAGHSHQGRITGFEFEIVASFFNLHILKLVTYMLLAV